MKSDRTPLISIGVPVYNGEALLNKTLRSLTKQSYKNIEIIISDNSSTDKTIEIIKKFKKNDSRIRLYRQSKNIKELPNFNFVLSKAKGAYFTWHAADDYRDPKNIETLYNLLQDNPEAVGSMCSYKNDFNGKTYFVTRPFTYNNKLSKIDSLKHFIRTGNIICLFGLYKTKILKTAGGHEIDSRPFHKGSDFLTVFRTLLKGKMVYTDKVLFYKVDTGLFTNRYTVIQTHLFSPNTISKIIRYLLSPIYFFYNLILGVRFIWQNNLSLFEKIDLSFYLFYFWMINNIRFLFDVLKGFLLVLQKLFRFS